MLLNAASHSLCQAALAEQWDLRIQSQQTSSGTTVLDFGVHCVGGLEAGLILARICMGGAAEVELSAPDRGLWPGPQIMVRTDAPVAACMASQYAGWAVNHEKFFAMGSGPMRSKRGKEPVLQALSLHDEGDVAVGVLECDAFPSDEVCRKIAHECRVDPKRLTLCVAPTRSIAGTLQVVARSIETSLHKLHELGFDLNLVRSGIGFAPLPPPAIPFASGIGRTNDAILYGGQVALWVECPDEAIEPLVEKLPSQASSDWGKPFAQIFKKYDYDFYKVDPGLFSPAQITIQNLKSGQCWRRGTLRADVLEESFTH